MKIFVVFLGFLAASTAQFDPYFASNRNGIVNLFEWKWSDIANECENFLAPNGYAGVQTSPPSENIVVTSPNRPWWERYQPVSYILQTRSGNEAEFLDMTTRCNAVGVRIYADVVLNEMTSISGTGTGGSTANFEGRLYPGVPYGPGDFNSECSISTYDNAIQVRNCWLDGMADLNQGPGWVRTQISNHLNHLISLGVAGFRVDRIKHMWPGDLGSIFGGLNSLNTSFGFPANSAPFMIQEIIDLDSSEAVSRNEYTGMGTIASYYFSSQIGKVFDGGNQLKWLVNWGPAWGFLPSNISVTFVDNYENQRTSGSIGTNVLNYKSAKQYKMATAFHLASDYGIPRIMSSFDFNSYDQGPPSDSNGNIISPISNADNSCGGGWICEHRWRQIYNMIGFKIVVAGQPVANWWDNGNNQIAFSRGSKGFIVFNGDSSDLNQNLQTGLPAGTYCDIISGSRVANACTGISIVVGNDGTAQFSIPANAYDGVIAIHIGQKLHTRHLVCRDI